MAKPFNRPHLFIRQPPNTERFSAPSSGGGKTRSQPRDQATHGARLKAEFEAALPLDTDEAPAFRFVFESEPGFDLELESLESERKGIELLNVRKAGTLTRAAVLIPRDKLRHFLGLFEDYLTRTRGPNDNPANKTLVESITHVRRASVRSLWTDAAERFPSGEDACWWEVWLRGRKDSAEAFQVTVRQAGLSVSRMPLSFVDRAVLNLRATVLQLSQLLEQDVLIAELREARCSVWRSPRPRCSRSIPGGGQTTTMAMGPRWRGSRCTGTWGPCSFPVRPSRSGTGWRA